MISRKIWNKGGELIYEAELIGDNYVVKEYFQNGNLKSRISFINNDKIGLWLFKDEQGKIIEAVYYE